MLTKTKPVSRRAHETDVTVAFRKYSVGVQIPMLKLTSVYEAGLEASVRGEDVNAAVKSAIQKYRIN
jgi:hypothetical protein